MNQHHPGLVHNFHKTQLTRRSLLSLGTAGVAGMFGCAGTNRQGSAGTFDGEVIIIGAGPAGMTAAHRLMQNGVRFTVLEATNVVGGRTRHNLDFVDFPISLGAEWVHVNAAVLAEIVNDETVDVMTELVGYNESALIGYYEDDEYELLTDTNDDLKFVESGWLDFYQRKILPGIAERIVYRSPVVSIDYSGDRIIVVDAGGISRLADRVIVTVPLKLLQLGELRFDPPLPESRQNVIANANVWSGMKSFIEFDRAFYPAFVAFADSDTANGQRLYYDATWGQRTSHAVLGLFAVGAQAERYQSYNDAALLQVMLAELDEVFDGAATATYRRHIVQNWNAEPFAGAAYLADVESTTTSQKLAAPIDNRVYFAGEAYTRFDDWGSVHAAARSAAQAVDEILI